MRLKQVLVPIDFSGCSETAMRHGLEVARVFDATLHRRRVVISCPIAVPATEILRYAEDESIDLIVMGAHGREHIGHTLIGSEAEQVVRRAPCPVLTVSQQQHPFMDVSMWPVRASVQA